MIQRIQTVYLLLVVALLITTMFFPVGYFVGQGTEGLFAYNFLNSGLTVDGTTHGSWGLLAILILSSIIAFATIFLYKNRILQIRMTTFNTILLIGYYIVFLIFFFTFKNALELPFNINWSLCLPLVAVILNYLAIRAIGKDEVLVKAADRLR